MASDRPRPRRWRLILGIGAALVVLVGAAATVFALTRPGDVSNPDVEFRAQEPTPTATPSPTPERRRKARDPLDSFEWPIYGYTPDRRRYLATKGMRPPFKQLWRRRLHALLEFSPVLDGRHLYLIDNLAYLWSIDKKTGKVRWRKRLGRLAASTPAYAKGRLYVTVLARAPGRAGRVVAVRARTGKVLWSRPLPSRTESSPVYDRGRIYFGSEDGTVYALRAATGRTVWTYRAAGAVKAGLALDEGKLYFGDYAGQMHAIRESSGRRIWQVGTSGANFGLSSGQFYSTPAVAYGRVYIGNTDANVYSFSARDGRLAWRHGTGGYVYSSPSVGKVPGGRPAVYIGSYDGTFYSLDARSGDVLWSRHEGGTISGGATIVGDVVYYSNNRLKTTTGRIARTGRVVFKLDTGAFNPVISDTARLYVTGFSSLYAFRPKRRG
jgi:outer membrane protein assembly factor BamB